MTEEKTKGHPAYRKYGNTIRCEACGEVVSTIDIREEDMVLVIVDVKGLGTLVPSHKGECEKKTEAMYK